MKNVLLYCVLAVIASLGLTSPSLHAQVPQLLNYQGRVAVGGVNFNGTGSFKFALVDTTGATTYWSNDGTSTAGSQPTTAVSLTVTNGLYSLALGDTTLANMTAVPYSVFSNSDVRLRVWFNDSVNGWQLLTPDQRLAAVGYAMVANQVANGAVGSLQLASGLTLGGTTDGTFSGPLTGNVSGNLNLAPTTSSSAGVITQNGNSLISTFGTNNFFAGAQAGNFTMTGSGNTGSGALTLEANTAGSNNTAVGTGALSANTTAGNNVAIGQGALHVQSYSNGGVAWSSDNVAVGISALNQNQPTSTATGVNNTALGSYALGANTTGNGNSATGINALIANTSGSFNTANGANTLSHNTTGGGNVAVGNGTLNANTIAGNNTAIGTNSLFNNTVGVSNTAAGSTALNGNTTAGGNVAIGVNALQTQSFSNSGNAWNSDNVALGWNALQLNQPTSTSTGIQNTALGMQALQNNTTGANNIALGYNAGSTLAIGNNNIDIGNVGVAAESSIIRIGVEGTQTAAFIAGIDGSTTSDSASTVAVMIDKNGNLGTIKSSRRYKEDIADMGEASARLLALRPVTFRYKKPYADGKKPIQFGLIAEEVAEVFPELTVFNDQGQPETVKYQDLPPLLLNEFLKDHRSADARDAEIARLREENAAMKQRQEEMRQSLAELEAKDKEREARLTRLENLLPPATLPAVAKTLSLSH